MKVRRARHVAVTIPVEGGGVMRAHVSPNATPEDMKAIKAIGDAAAKLLRSAHPETVGKAKIQPVPVDALPMVTFDDPNASPMAAANGFARIRPTEDMAPEVVRSWVDSVRSVARAHRVLPVRRSAAVPTAAERPDVFRPAGTIRDEIYALVREANDPDLAHLVDVIIADVTK